MSSTFEFKWILCVFLILLLNLGTANGEGHYTIVGPESIVSNQDYTVSVAVHHIREPVFLKIGISGPSDINSQDVKLSPTDPFKQITFKVPALIPGEYNLTGEGLSGLKFLDSIGLHYRSPAEIAVLLTDRNTYRPGDTVNYYCLVMDEQLRPNRDAEEMVIGLVDPQGIHIDKERNSKVVSGVYSGQFQLSEKAALGQYEIFCENSNTRKVRSFNLELVKLPKFIVQIDAPKRVSLKDNEMEILVKANPVSGKAGILITFMEENAEGDKSRLNNALSASNALAKGQRKFNFNLTETAKDLCFMKSDYIAIINATVEDNLSGANITETLRISLVCNSHIVECFDLSCFLPWTQKDNRVSIKITTVDGTLVNDTQSVVKLIYTEGSGDKLPFYLRKYTEKLQYVYEGLFLGSGVYAFEANPPYLPEKSFDITVEYAGELYPLQQTWPEWFATILSPEKTLLSPRNHLNFSLRIHAPSSGEEQLTVLRIGEEYQVTLTSKHPFDFFVYEIIGRGGILKSGRVELPRPQMEHNFTLTTTYLTSPRVYVHAYYIDQEGVLQYTSTTYKVTVELQNEIMISLPNSGSPGQEVELEIKTEPNSFVVLLAVEEKLPWKYSNRDLNLPDLYWQLEKYQYPQNLVTMTSAKDKRRKWLRSSNMVKTPYRDFSAPSTDLTKTFSAMESSLRFTETWIFADIKRTERKVSKLVNNLPDTLGSWLISGLSLHPVKGLGVFQNNRTIISSITPYSIYIHLPNSVKLGESILVPVVVSNHLPDELEIELILSRNIDQFDLVDGPRNQSQLVKIKGFEAESVTFLIRPKVCGNNQLNFTINTSMESRFLTKSLKVVPEGITEYKNHAILINLTDTGEYASTFRTEFPKEIVPGTDQVQLGLAGDLIVPIIENLDNLFPSGTCEMVMSKMATNYLVWNYLNNTNRLTPKLDASIKRNLREIYQNLLIYRHGDGSFSPFGPDKSLNGSVWLTSYVLRYIGKIQDVIYIDKKIFHTAYDYILSRQTENGSFAEDNEYGLEVEREFVLTSNALLALLEHDKPGTEVITKTVAYLSSQVERTKELLPKSMAIYALLKSQAPEAPDLVAHLQLLAQQRPYSQDVGITCFALLSLLESPELEMSEFVWDSIQWLLTQRNRYFGFSSSQDTVVCLTALIKFVEKSGYKAAKWEVTVANKDRENSNSTIFITRENDLLLQTIEFPSGTKALEFQAKGTGIALVQISYRFNVLEKKSRSAFKIKITVPPQMSANLKLMVCLELTEESQTSKLSNLEVSLPTGYSANEDSFVDLLETEQLRLVETRNNGSVVVVYLENLYKDDSKCIPFKGYRTHNVLNRKPCSVLLYDYYDKTNKVTEYYSFNSEAY